jgi:hypothetical protein
LQRSSLARVARQQASGMVMKRTFITPTAVRQGRWPIHLSKEIFKPYGHRICSSATFFMLLHLPQAFALHF